MTTYLISNAVTWIGLTRFQSGDALIVTPGAALVLPATDLSDLEVGGPTMISFGGYVAMQSLAVDGSVTFGITATGQLVSSAQGAAIALHAAHLDMAGQITAANGTAVAMIGDVASLASAGRIAGQVGVELGATAGWVANSGWIEGTGTGVWVTGDDSTLHNSGTISAPVAVQITTAGTFTLTNAGLIHGDILSTGANHDTVHNSGTIVGDVRLGAGNDSFAGGHVQGDLDMGLGNDRTDARGDVVSGIIMDAGGDDTYVIDSALTRISDTGAGRDSVQAWCSYTLPSGLEVLTLRGAQDLNGFGNGQSNRICGNSGNNRLLGGGGADRLLGGAGDDSLHGGFGDDLLRGDQGADHLTGGWGSDRFVFTALSDTGASADGADTIADFAQGIDKIDVSAIDADSTNATDSDSFAFLGEAAFSHQAGQVRYVIASGQTLVELDVNGDALADATLVLTAQLSLTGADFIL